MAKRDLQKTVSEGRSIAEKHHKLDLSIGEYLSLMKNGEQQENLSCSAISAAYYLGLATGARYGKRASGSRAENLSN